MWNCNLEDQMSPRMQDFLQRASQAEIGKGIPVRPYDRRIASKAVTDGYGWMIEAPLRIFIIDRSGRDALDAA